MDDRDRLTPPAPLAPPAPLTGPPVDVRATWRWWEAILLFLVVLVAQVIVSLPFGESLFLTDTGELLSGVIFGVLLGGGTLLWIRVGHRPASAALGIPSQPGRDVAAGLGWGLAIRLLSFPVIIAVTLLVDAISEQEVQTPEQIAPDLSGAGVVLAILVALVVAPAAEELFFRGFLFRALRARNGFALSAAVSSLAFGLVHFQPEGLLASLPLMVGVGSAAVGFAWIYDRRRSILAPIVAHMVFNVVGVAFILAGS